MSNQAGPPPGRPKSPTRKVLVEHVTRVTPLVTRVTFSGPQLAGFGPPRPGSHMKLLFVPEGTSWDPSDEAAPRPPRRTYTPRRYDDARRQLEIEFVHHGDGLAASWAASARTGDALYVTGPGGGYEVPADATDVVIVADETAMPAAGMILESLPATCRPAVFCEIANGNEERQLSPTVAAEVKWLHRETNGSQPGTLLEAQVRAFQPANPATTCWWIACEAGAMRRIRQHLLRDRKVDAARLHTRGYWKLGETAYPDHDYGKD